MFFIINKTAIKYNKWQYIYVKRSYINIKYYKNVNVIILVP